MSNYKLVPFEPTPEMVSAAEDAYMPFGDMDLALRMAILAAPDMQGEPVAWSGWGCQYPSKMPRLYGERRIAELNCDLENGDQLLYFTTDPQPAEQQPSPDVAELVEALDLALEYWRDRQQRYKNRRPKWVIAAESALADYRKGGEG